VHRHVIHVDTPLEHARFTMACAQQRRHVPTYFRQNTVLGDMGSLEAYGHAHDLIGYVRQSLRIYPEEAHTPSESALHLLSYSSYFTSPREVVYSPTKKGWSVGCISCLKTALCS
jgi:hypothetical protein